MFKLKTILSGHQNPVYSMALSKNNNRLFSAGADKGVVEWDLEQATFKKVFSPLQHSAFFIYQFEECLAVANRMGKVQIYDLNLNQKIAELQAGEKAIFAVYYLASKKELLTAGEDGILRIWNPYSGKHLSNIVLNTEALRCIAYHKEKDLITIGSKNGKLFLLNGTDFSVIQILDAHEKGITALAFHPNQNLLLTGSRDATIKIWDIENWVLQANFTAHMNTVYGIIFHPKLPWFATCSQDKSIKIWNSEDFRLLKILSMDKLNEGHKHTVNAILWDKSGELLISTGDDRQVILWELSDTV